MIRDILKILFNILKQNEFNFLNDLLCFKKNLFISTYEQKQKKLGMKKLLEVEYIRSLLDLLVNSYASNLYKKDIKELVLILNKKNIFYSLHQIFFNFPFCNIFQIYYSQIVDIITNIYTPDYLANYFILNNKEEENKKESNNKQNNNLISFIIMHIMNKSQFIYNSKRIALNPCLTYEINILNQLINCNNDTIQSISEENKDLLVFNEVLSGDLNSILKSKLLYNENNEIEIGEEIPEKNEYSFDFKNKNLYDIINERKQIYYIYKQGGDYKKVLNEKDKKSNNGNDMTQNEINLNSFEIFDNPIFKIEEIKEENEYEENSEKEKEINKREIIRDNEKKYYDFNYWKVEPILNKDYIDSLLNELD